MEDDASAAGDLESHNGSESVGGDSASFAVVKQEVRMMNVVRTFVFALLMTMGTIAADVLFVVVQIQEENASKEDFAAFALQLIDEFHASIHQKMVVANSLATSLSLEAQSLKWTWPYVSFAEFDLRCASAQELSQAASITYLPRVDNQTRKQWENYVGYIDAQIDDNESTPTEKETPENPTALYVDSNRSVQDGIYYLEDSHPFTLGPVTPGTFIFPIWQRTGEANIQEEFRMYDQASNKIRSPAMTAVVQHRVPARMGVLSDFLYRDTSDYVYFTTPRAALYYPIHATTSRDQVVALLDFELPWESVWKDVLDEGTAPLVIVVESSCGRQFTFQVKGGDVVYLGEGDRHIDPKTFDGPDPIASTFANYSGSFLAGIDINTTTTTTTTPSPCAFRIHVYMTAAFRQSYLTNAPMITRWIVLGVFCCTVGIFICYDCVVETRSNRVVETAKRTDALVSTLFPSSVKAQLLANAAAKREAKIAKSKKAHKEWEYHQSRELPTTIEEGDEDQEVAPFLESNHGPPVIRTPKNRLQNFLQPGDGIDGLLDIHEGEPIADLFPNASVMFADIAGFTAWSSEREPTQVFKLLETLYRAMDKAAKRFKVFKVETIGDCYVAATGLPDPRDDHLEALVRFARTSLFRTNEITRALEAILGPGTAELALRFGIHSGPVTAGVLRGEKARFQLFGDTMNFAARMESTGVKNKIQLSEASAALLKKRKKGHWVVPREEKVFAKGKGELQTYWLQVGSSSKSIGSCGMSVSSGDSGVSDVSSVDEVKQTQPRTPPPAAPAGDPGNVLMGVIGEAKVSKSVDRLVEWNTNALALLLQKVIVSRNGKQAPVPEQTPDLHVNGGNSRSFMSELEMTIPLPQYDEASVKRTHSQKAQLPQNVRAELRFYVAAIASGYRKNAFHNFEHASHVILSATKLLNRINYADGHDKEDGVTTHDLHNYTYGISSDPLTQFAIVFSALVHDVGHEGVPNGQLVKELPDLASSYDFKSVAEQRSVDVALELLMLPKYRNLRNCIYATESEQKRFRQLLVHCVLATDIFDPDLKARRNLRWDQAFHPINKANLQGQEDMNRKATIVLEHIIQASDVSHTMQHWHVYIKWNERLYQEMYAAYKAGRSKTDPTEGWYKAEMWFYDNYVIPLAKKLKECKVFGVSSDEYLDYATQNRIEWEQRGVMIVQSMKERVQKLYEKVEMAPDMEGDESEHVYQELEEERLKLPDLNANDGDLLDDGHNSLHSYSNH